MPAPKDTTVRNYADGACPSGLVSDFEFDRTQGYNWQGDAQSNVRAFVTDPKEIVADLFKGATGGGEEGKAGKACSASEGAITGIGPDCVKDKEEGEYDLSLCFYEETFDCLRIYKDRTAEAARTYADQFADSEWQHFNVNIFAGYTPDEGRQLQIDANLEYNACIERVVDECECKECAYTFQKPIEEEEDDEEETETDPTTDKPDKDITKTEKKTTSATSNFGPIARVYGRYVVGGNIIWLGKKDTVTNVRYVTNPDGVSEFNANQSRCEFVVGVCVGELDSVLRVWMNDVLVLNYTIDMDDPTASSYTDMNLSFLADDSNNTEEAYNKIVQFKLFKGSSAQKVNKEIADFEGFGRVPAHRDLAYIHIKNVDLRLFGGSFPSLRFDVTSMPAVSVINKVESEEYLDLNTEQLGVDVRLNNHVVQQTNEHLVIVDRDSVEHHVIDYPSIYCAYPTSYNRILGLSELDGSIVIDPYLQDYVIGGGYTPEIVAQGMMIRQLKMYTNKRPFEVFPYVTDTQGVAIIKYGTELGNETAASDVIHFGFDAPPGFATKGFEIAAFGGTTYGYQFGMDSGLFTIVRSTILSGGALDTSGVLTVFTKNPSVIWGSETDLVIYNTMFDGSDTSFIIFGTVASGTKDVIFKIKARDLSIAWATQSPYALMSWNKSNQITTNFAEPNYYFISADQEIVKLERSSGSMTLVDTLPSLAFPQYEPDNGQFYCALTKSISYISTDTGVDPKIVRIFVDRLGEPQRPSIADVIRSMLVQANLPKSFIDLSDVEDITIGGYLIQSRKSIREVIETFAGFYRLSMIDDGAKLTLKKQSSISTAISIDEDMDVSGQTLETRRVVPTSQTDAVTARIVDIDETGLIESIQTVTISEQTDQTKVPREKRYDLELYDKGEFIRPYLEVALVASRADEDVFTAQLMPRRLAITANDRVVLGGKDYRITGNYLSPDNVTGANASLFFFDVVNESTELSGIVVNSNARVAKSGKAYPYKPVVLFTNALTEEDALRAATVRQVAYSLIEAHTPDIEPTRLQTYIHAHSGKKINNLRFTDRGQDINVPNSPTYTSAVHTKAAHSGVLQLAPEDRSEGLFSCSRTDSMKVTFHRDDTVALLKNFANTSDVTQTTDNFLIVNGEYIQFANYTVEPSDPSGRTVILTNLYRGLLGTDAYANGFHFDSQGYATNSLLPGLRVYLYTADTVKPFGVSARYTKRGAMAAVYMKQFTPAGVSQPDYAFVSDAGSARAWTPTHVKVYRKITTFGDGRKQINAYLSWKRREPYIVDQLENGGEVTNVFRSDVWLMPRMEGSGGDVVISGSGSTEVYSGRITFPYTVSSVESRFTDSNVALHFENSADGTEPYDDKDILRFNTLAPGVNTFVPASARYTAIAQITYDEYGEPILGYPLPVRVSAGWTYTNPAPP